MSEYTKLHLHVGAQNDGVFIFSGRAPSLNNDYPVHGTDRTVIASLKSGDVTKDIEIARRIATCVNALDGLPQDALDGGWTAAGISQYAKRLELIVKLTASAIEKAGFTEIDNPADAIEILVQQRDDLLAELIEARDALKSRGSVASVKNADAAIAKATGGEL